MTMQRLDGGYPLVRFIPELTGLYLCHAGMTISRVNDYLEAERLWAAYVARETARREAQA